MSSQILLLGMLVHIEFITKYEGSRIEITNYTGNEVAFMNSTCLFTIVIYANQLSQPCKSVLFSAVN